VTTETATTIEPYFTFWFAKYKTLLQTKKKTASKLKPSLH